MRKNKKLDIIVIVLIVALILSSIVFGVYNLLRVPTLIVDESEKEASERIYCEEPRPQICTLECLAPPPYLCGSDGKFHCTVCQACGNPEIEWYVYQDETCEKGGY